MTKAGHEVTLHTRRASRNVRSRVDKPAGYHVPARPPRLTSKDDLLPFTGECSDFLRDHWATARYSCDRIAADTIRAYAVAAPEPVTARKPRSRAEAR
jgi:hypothetical protein